MNKQRKTFPGAIKDWVQLDDVTRELQQGIWTEIFHDLPLGVLRSHLHLAEQRHHVLGNIAKHLCSLGDGGLAGSGT